MMARLLTDRAAGESRIAKGGVTSSQSLALATLLFVLFLTFLDNTIVTVVLAHVQSELHASVTQLQWVVNGYALTFAGLMLSFGTAGDLLGRKKVMLGRCRRLHAPVRSSPRSLRRSTSSSPVGW